MLIPKRVTIRLEGEDDILKAAMKLLSSRKSNTITDALKTLMRMGLNVEVHDSSEDIDRLLKFQLQTLALLQRQVGSHDENMIRVSKDDARSMYQQIRDRNK